MIFSSSYSQKVYVNKDWETSGNLQTSTIQRTISKLDNDKNLVVLGHAYNAASGSVDVRFVIR